MTHFEKLSFCSGGNLKFINLVRYKDFIFNFLFYYLIFVFTLHLEIKTCNLAVVLNMFRGANTVPS